MNLSKKGRWIIIGCVITFLLLVAGIVIYSSLHQQALQNKANSTYIEGVNDCSSNINTTVLNDIQTQLYQYIVDANNYNKITSQPNYHAVVRKGSCQTLVGAQDSSDSTTTAMIVDVPAAKQSWKVTYSWVSNSTAITTDLGAIIAECPSDSQLIYGDFHCSEVLSLLTHGTASTDAILEYMPYSGAGFNLSYDAPTKTVTASILVKTENQDNQILIDNIKSQIQYWFMKRSLNINSYTVNYTVTTDDDNGL